MNGHKDKLDNIIVMKVGPHSGMPLSEIITSKNEEEQIHGAHFWGYSGVFCQPRQTQMFCDRSLVVSKRSPKLILIETKSSYTSSIGYIRRFSSDGVDFEAFKGPVQLQGAQFAFVAKNLRELNDFSMDDYIVYGGKNDGKPLSQHLRYRVNKSFAILNPYNNYELTSKHRPNIPALEAELVHPFAIWLKE